jgi:hypothetical protein
LEVAVATSGTFAQVGPPEKVTVAVGVPAPVGGVVKPIDGDANTVNTIGWLTTALVRSATSVAVIEASVTVWEKLVIVGFWLYTPSPG